MKKIVSNVLVVSTQLIVGGLFLLMLFSGGTEDSRVAVVENNNLNKMADAVAELFEVDHILTAPVVDLKAEEELKSVEEKAKEEEEARKKAEEEARQKAAEEEAARLEAERKAQEAAALEEARRLEAEKKAQEEAARVVSSNQSVAALQEYAHGLVINTYGWSEADFVALVNLWNRESGWGVTAGNPSSGAYGIPQSLPGNKMASEGADWASNGETQIRWGLKYILSTYGSPSNAWGHFLSHNWY